MTTKCKRTHSNEDSKRSPAKRKFRNENEKRRRDLFSQLVVNLEDILNIDKTSLSDDQTSSPTNKLDKASILRETAIYLRKHQQNLTISTNQNPSNVDRTNDILNFSWKPSSNIVSIEEWIQTTIESMNCFFLVAKFDSYNGQIIYVSKNINSLLDYSQNELINRSLFEFILPRDHDQFRDYLLQDHKILEKCNLSWRRATADEYEQCTIIGAFRQSKKSNEKYLMSIVKVNTLDKTLVLTNENTKDEFIIRLNVHGKFIHIDSKTRQFLGYNSYELIGHTFFDFVHPDDLPIVVRAHQLWKESGSGLSDPYRFLSKGQQWIFLQTNCQVQINSWTGKAESYICTTNTLQNSNHSVPKQLSRTLTSTQMITSSIESPLTPNPQIRNSSSDTQITSFLSHLGNEMYRTNIREKLNERRLCKQAEIRLREEEIKVIEDIIQFINDFQSRNSTNTSQGTINCSLSFPSTTINSTYQTNKINQETSNIDFINRNIGIETNCDLTLLQSPLTATIEDLSPRPSPMISRHVLSTDSQQFISTRDESIIDPLGCSLFSPQQGTFSLSSPLTPFSRPSPMTPGLLSVSPIPISPVPQSISPLNNPSTINDINNLVSSSSSSSSSTATLTTNSNIRTTEQTSRRSSFNRSLPHSLVS